MVRIFVPTDDRDLDRAFDMLLTFDLAKIKVLFGESRFGPTVN
jgi:hypothetical protein